MKLIKYLFLLVPVIMITSCIEDQERIFDDVPAIRMQKTIDEYKSLLTSASNGWIMNYYPETNHAAGGFAMYYKFSPDGNANIACEIETNVAPREIATSTWDVIPYQGPVLTFDTYNPVLHYFSEVSSSSDRDGRAGDYEFVIMSTTADTVYLKGLKNNNRIVMWKADNDPIQYMKEITDLFNKLKRYKNFDFSMNGNKIGNLTMSSIVTNDLLNRKFSITYKKNDKDTTEVRPFAYTPAGITLHSNLVINGVTLRNFSYNDAERTYTCSDPGVNANFVCTDGEILGYEIFLGEYTMRYATTNTNSTPTRSLNVTLVVEKEDISYRLLGLLPDDSPAKIIVDYLDGNIQIRGQIIHVWPDTRYDLWFLPYSIPNSGSNYTSRSTTVGIISTDMVRTDGKVKFGMKDNGVWGSNVLAGFMFRNYNGSTNAGNVNGKDGQPNIFFPSFEQK